MDRASPFIADRAIVYHFDGVDSFAVGSDLVEVPNPTGFPSVWGIPTFFDIHRALEHYAGPRVCV